MNQPKHFVSQPRFDPAIVLKNDSTWPRVSVVIPSYNQGQFIEHALLSVLNQNYPNTELIVIDGGSTDATLDVLQRYSPYLSFFLSEPDRGQFDAVIKGFEHATGDILTWQNSDDLYTEGAFHKVVKEFKIHPSNDLIFGNVCVLDESLNVTRVAKYVPVTLEGMMYYSAHVPSQSAFWTRRVFQEVRNSEQIRRDLHYCMEKYFFGLILHYGQGALYRRSIFGAVRVQPESKTVRVGPHEEWRREDLDIARDFVARGFIKPYSNVLRYKLFLRKLLWHAASGDISHLIHLASQRSKWKFTKWKTESAK
jgi:glycosyltransferase involved in cell wall biosynthesis